jgi:hypothetical protein
MPAGRALSIFDTRLIQVYTTGALLGKDVRYTPPRGMKTANPGGGIYLKYAAYAGQIEGALSGTDDDVKAKEYSIHTPKQSELIYGLES